VGSPKLSIKVGSNLAFRSLRRVAVGEQLIDHKLFCNLSVSIFADGVKKGTLPRSAHPM
jgi:hypothetical protein